MITESTDIRNAKRAEKLRPLKELLGKTVNLINSLYERNERMRERKE